MKQIRYISAILLTALTLSFSACGNDDESDNFNYQETMAKYENTTFEGYIEAWVGEDKNATIEIQYMYESNGNTFLACTHSKFLGFCPLGYDKVKKSFYMLVSTKRGDNYTLIVKFIDNDIIQVDNTIFTCK